MEMWKNFINQPKMQSYPIVGVTRKILSEGIEVMTWKDIE